MDIICGIKDGRFESNELFDLLLQLLTTRARPSDLKEKGL